MIPISAPQSEKTDSNRYRLFILLLSFVPLLIAIWLWAGTTVQQTKADTPAFALEFQGVGNFAFIADGVGTRGDPVAMTWTGVGTITLDIPATATVHEARLIWSGRAAVFDADGVLVQVDGGAITPVAANPAYQFAENPWCCGGLSQLHESADIVSLIQTGVHTYTISGHEHSISSTTQNLNYGVGVWVVYEDVGAPAASEIIIYEGQDSFVRTRTSPQGPHSNVRCASFTANSEARLAHITHLVSGVNTFGHPDGRSDAFWFISGELPTDPMPPPDEDPGLVALPGAIGYDPGGQYPLNSLDGLEWDNMETNGLPIPAGHNWMCFQIESGDSQDLAGLGNVGLAASGQWDLFAIQIEPPPTAVTLLSFGINSIVGNEVTLGWETAAEIDNFGFNLYRAPVNDFAQATKIHFEPSAVPGGSGSGASYSHIDNMPSNDIYYYWLEDVDTSGNKVLHNPVSTVGFNGHITRQFLPLIIDSP